MLKKNVLNEIRKVRNELKIDAIIMAGKIRGDLDSIVERINELEKYLNIAFTIEETPRVIKKGYKKAKKNK